MKDSVSSLVLKVESGIQAGACLVVPSGDIHVGSGLDCEIIIGDPSLASSHFLLNSEPVRQITAVSAVVSIVGGPVLQPGDVYEVWRSTAFKAGATLFRLDPGMPDVVPARSRRRELPLLSLAAILVPMTVITLYSQPAGTAVIEHVPLNVSVPATIQAREVRLPSSPTELDPVAAMARRTSLAGLSTISISADGDGTVNAEGSVSIDLKPSWEATKQWFDEAFGARAVLVDRVRLSASEAPLSVAAVQTGEAPFVIDRAGVKFFPGSEIPGGWTVSSIDRTHIVVSRGGQSLAIRY